MRRIDYLAAYSELREKYPHTTLHPGDIISMKGLKVEVVASAGEAIEKPPAGAGQPNPLCASYQALKPDTGEKLGWVDIYMTTHYGMASSGSPRIV